MKFFIAALLALSVNAALAQEKMGEEAVEMMDVMSNSDAYECVSKVGTMMGVEISKVNYRCTGCTTYTITGRVRYDDMISSKKTTITLQGYSVSPGFGFNYIQKFNCNIKEE